MLVAKGIIKLYGNLKVLRGVDLSVERGQILGLMGVNGAGKTTLISILAGLTRPDAGDVHIGGVDLLRHRRQAARHIGVAPQALGIYPTLTVQENLDCFAGLAGYSGRKARSRTAEIARLMGLQDLLDRPAGHLSGGQQRRLHTGMALLGHPDVLFLDEPTVGSDVQSREVLLSIVTHMANEGTAVIYTTHYPAELEQLDATINVLVNGRITVTGSVQEVTGQWASSSIFLHFRGKTPEVDGWKEDRGGLVPIRPVSDPGQMLGQTLSTLGAAAGGLDDVRITRPSLEAAYLAITGDHALAEKEASDVVAA
ncbi:ABC transporter ATP-binding protein [Propionibacterium freudenreichii]|uniref:ABC transporter ATP-binding protein n=1 Tax=Propionibacterium freudenreichii TaxID=1744 RepID=UPI000542CBC3|nr:ABC transporter ATP-binding protein [Propionibacterium freudenreichii]MDK9643328.1 ABC transporter ATP-binding protein [Propionibacterium freudenreichii]CEG86169.1 ABC superfamily ATP binding cassette transporter, ABC protein [Propionibacterium freudenreichii]CEI26506.1 ABC superfamily ATP binding cassette transporter, ABC protein [Propionibacterium freudenreichii]